MNIIYCYCLYMHVYSICVYVCRALRHIHIVSVALGAQGMDRRGPIHSLPLSHSLPLFAWVFAGASCTLSEPICRQYTEQNNLAHVMCTVSHEHADGSVSLLYNSVYIYVYIYIYMYIQVSILYSDYGHE